MTDVIIINGERYVPLAVADQTREIESLRLQLASMTERAEHAESERDNYLVALGGADYHKTHSELQADLTASREECERLKAKIEAAKPPEQGASDGHRWALQAQLDAVAEALGAERMARHDGYHYEAVKELLREAATQRPSPPAPSPAVEGAQQWTPSVGDWVRILSTPPGILGEERYVGRVGKIVDVYPQYRAPYAVRVPGLDSDEPGDHYRFRFDQLAKAEQPNAWHAAQGKGE